MIERGGKKERTGLSCHHVFFSLRSIIFLFILLLLLLVSSLWDYSIPPMAYGNSLMFWFKTKGTDRT
jgi:hypothetical protein